MCGIAGWYCWGDKRPTPDTLKALLIVNQSRGRDAAGVAYIDPGDSEVTVLKSPGPAEKLVREIDEDRWARIASSPRGLLHTRAQTKGTPAKNENNHPVVGFGWVVVHNGSVQNDDSLFSYYKEERPAEVDTIALPLVLGKGRSGNRESLMDSLEGLTIVGGSATFAAISPQDPETVILGRLGYNDVYLFADARANILYWSSAAAVEKIMPSVKLGCLRFTTVSKLNDERVVVLNPDFAKCETFKVDRHPFFRRNYANSWTSAGTGGGTKRQESQKALTEGEEAVETSSKSGIPKIEIMEPKLQRNFRWVQAVDSMTQLGKPKPIFHDVDLDWAYFYSEESAFLKQEKHDQRTIKTGYGAWHFKKATDVHGTKFVIREFHHHKRMKRFFHTLFSQKFKPWDELPVSIAQSTTALDFLFPREDVYVEYNVAQRTEAAHMHGGMCPWCGVLLPQPVWSEGGDRCRWCNVRSVTAFNYNTARLLHVLEKDGEKKLITEGNIVDAG